MKDIGRLALSSDGSGTLQQQVFQQVRSAILDGHLKPGSKLPSTRSLAQLAGVSRATVVFAYEQLKAEGYLESREGAGSYVSQQIPELSVAVGSQGTRAKERSPRTRSPRLSAYAASLTSLMGEPQRELLRTGQFTAFPLGVPALEAFPFKLWSQIHRRHIKHLQGRWLGYASPQGYPPLREAIANHLAMSRGILCAPDQIVIVNGSQQALSLVAHALLNPGDTVVLEDPGYLGARAAFLSARATIVPAPVDEQGIQTSTLDCARLAYVTPSHQFPLGHTMALSRRGELLNWARDCDSYIFEDDYDSEFRYEGRPLQPLFSIDTGERVIYSGTFTKIMFPSLRLGYLIAPRELVPTLIALRRFFDVHSPTLEQAVLADFIAEGHFARHIRKMRKLYRERLECLTQLFPKTFGTSRLRFQSAKAGMHALVWLGADEDDEAIARRSAEAGLQVAPLSPLYLGPAKRGLLLGYACTNEARIKAGLNELKHQLETRALAGAR